MSENTSAKRIGIIGGGIAGLTAAYEFEKARLRGSAIDWHLFEASTRLGGIVETHRQSGFTIECGPDGWLTDKPAARILATELGLGPDLIHSLDRNRRTYLLLDGQLTPIPDGMRMMVPTDLTAIDQSALFSPVAKLAFHAEPNRAADLLAAAPNQDESIASFVRRHFGDEVLRKVAAPLLSGVFGGDVRTLSVRAVMAPFVAHEREFGSLISALAHRPPSSQPIFTSLRTGVGTLVDRLVATLPPDRIHLQTPIQTLNRTHLGWQTDLPTPTLPQTPPQTPPHTPPQTFDHLLLATPAHITAALLHPLSPRAAGLLPTHASSAITIAFAFQDAALSLPVGFGFLAPPGGPHSVLAATFVDQKYPHRVPPGGQLLRAFFGAGTAEHLLPQTDGQLSSLALTELRAILGPIPTPAFHVVRRWPHSLPQYAVGHLDRMAELFSLLTDKLPNLTLLGNSYRGVGLPDLIRDTRDAAHRLSEAL